MKVLLLNRSYYPHLGGIENSLYNLSRELYLAGHDVTILTQEISEDCPYRKEYATVIKYPRFKPCRLQLPLLPKFDCKRISSWISENRQSLISDLVICRDPVLGSAYSRIFPDATVVYIPAVIIKYYNKGIRKSASIKDFVKEVLRFTQLRIETYYQKQVLHHADKVIVFSQNVKKQLKKGNLCAIDKVSVCYPGVSEQYVCRNLNTSNSSLNFVFVGRLVAEKNLTMLIDAFAQLKHDGKHLTLVGDGDQRHLLETKVRNLRLQNAVHFAGASNHPETYYAESTFFVFPSTYEAFGQVVIEALSMGLPVIGFPTIEGKTMTAIDELIQDGSTGFICKDFSTEALCACMGKAASTLSNHEEYMAMRENAIKFSSSNCSWKTLATSCLEIVK